MPTDFVGSVQAKDYLSGNRHRSECAHGNAVPDASCSTTHSKCVLSEYLTPSRHVLLLTKPQIWL